MIKRLIIVALALTLLLTPTSILGQNSDDFPLSNPGLYSGSMEVVRAVDESRDRTIQILIWYPRGETVLNDAPFPLILSQSEMASSFGSLFASHGFVLATMRDNEELNPFWLLDFPLDLLFTLNLLADDPPEALEGIIDTDHVGVIGYSSGGQGALALSGARIDPEFYWDECTHLDRLVPEPSTRWINYNCMKLDEWQAFLTYAEKVLPNSADGLLQPLNDERIRAVMPMAFGFSRLYSQQGLATVDRPTLIITGTEDTPGYLLDTAYAFDQLVGEDKALISFVDKAHLMIYEEKASDRIMHFAMSFFGYYLQGKTEYADYFSEAFVNQFDDLHWGIYQSE